MRYELARDKNGQLILFEGKPFRDKTTWGYYTIHSCCREITEHYFSSKIIDQRLFPDVTWESEPLEVFLMSRSNIGTLVNNFLRISGTPKEDTKRFMEILKNNDYCL